jgi:hypothetical protein
MVEDSQDHEQASEVDRDAHRGFVREMNQGFSSVYGYGGAVMVAVIAGGLVVAAKFGLLGSPLVWIAAVVLFLVGLFVLRIVVGRRARRMYERIDQYCAINEVPIEEFRERYSGEGLYPYFESIFEVLERRQKLQNQLRQRDSK